MLLRSGGVEVPLVPIRTHPEEAGLVGAVQLAPAGAFAGYGSILAVDIGGTNIRAGCVRLHGADSPEPASVAFRDHWRHRDDQPTATRPWAAWFPSRCGGEGPCGLQADAASATKLTA